jgi:glutaredoxin 2
MADLETVARVGFWVSGFCCGIAYSSFREYKRLCTEELPQYRTHNLIHEFLDKQAARNLEFDHALNEVKIIHKESLALLEEMKNCVK